MDQETRGQELSEQQLKRRTELEEKVATRAMALALLEESGMEFAFESFCPLGRELLEYPPHFDVQGAMNSASSSSRSRRQVLAALGSLAQAFQLVSDLTGDTNLYVNGGPLNWSLRQTEAGILRMMKQLGMVLLLAGEEWTVDLADAQKAVTDLEEERVEFVLGFLADRDREAETGSSERREPEIGAVQ